MPTFLQFDVDHNAVMTALETIWAFFMIGEFNIAAVFLTALSIVGIYLSIRNFFWTDGNTSQDS